MEIAVQPEPPAEGEMFWGYTFSGISMTAGTAVTLAVPPAVPSTVPSPVGRASRLSMKNLTMPIFRTHFTPMWTRVPSRIRINAVNLNELKRIQLELVHRVRLKPFHSTIKYVAGGDISYNRGNNTMTAVIAVLDYPSLRLVEIAHHTAPVEFPYIPTFLSFRELPALKAAFGKLKITPELVIIDGQGIAHPRGLGIAAHFGVEMDIPTIGCAKSHLFGRYEEPGEQRGCWTPLWHGNKIIGAVVRTRERVKPVFVSPGHLVDVESSVEWILKLTAGYKLPEPIRFADSISRRIAHEGI